MSAEWALGVVVAIFMGKVDIMNCIRDRTLQLCEHGTKVLEKGVKTNFVD